MIKKLLFVLFFTVLFSNNIFSQQSDSSKEFIIDLEFRPRFEFRNGYRTLRTDSTIPATFTSQRTRLNFTFKQRGFLFYTSIQDVRVWGESSFGSIQAFEGYVVQKLTDKFSIKIGRQTLKYDEQRLFAENDWGQRGRNHDALNFQYRDSSFSNEFVAAFNQPSENIYGTNYSYYIYSNYKLLVTNYSTIKLNQNSVLYVLNAADGYQSFNYVEKINTRFTNGGRFEYKKNKLKLALSAYYQHGFNFLEQTIKAYYFQPEVMYKTKKLNLTLGMEVLSGDNPNNPNSLKETYSFVPLYGVAHKFNGYMDYYISYPYDVNNAGLVNPYFKINYTLNKFSIANHFHAFYTEKEFYKNVSKTEMANKYLGFEHDIVFKYAINNFSNLELGLCYMLPTESVESLNFKMGNSALMPVYSYLMFTLKPELFRMKK